MSTVMRENTSDRGYSIPRAQHSRVLWRPHTSMFEVMSGLDKKGMTTLPNLKELGV